MKWNLFFIAQSENIGTVKKPEHGFVLGTHKVPETRVVVLKTQGLKKLFIYTTEKDNIANQAYNLLQFRGFGYTDMAVRVVLGIGHGTANEMKHIIGAHWYLGAGEDEGWRFGSIADWQDAGSPQPVRFGRYRSILGVDIE